MVTPEFSHIIDLSEPLSFTKTVELKATPEECQQLGQRFHVTLKSFKARVSLSPVSGTKMIRLTGALTACITQHCGVTLLTTEHTVTSDVDVFLSPEKGKDKHKDHLDTLLAKGLPQDDDYEFYRDSKVDIGEIIAQYLCMSINPYFKKSDALLEETTSRIEPLPKKVNPFAALQRLTSQDGGHANSPASSRRRA